MFRHKFSRDIVIYYYYYYTRSPALTLLQTMSFKSPSYFNPDDVDRNDKVLFWRNNITSGSPPPASPPPTPNSGNAAHFSPMFDCRPPSPASLASCLEYPPSLLAQLAHNAASLAATKVDDSDDDLDSAMDTEAIQFFRRNAAQAQFQQDWVRFQHSWHTLVQCCGTLQLAQQKVYRINTTRSSGNHGSASIFNGQPLLIL